MSNETAPTFVEWVEAIKEKNVAVSISGEVIFASRRTLARLFVSYRVYLLDNNFPIPEYPEYLDEPEPEPEEPISPTARDSAQLPSSSDDIFDEIMTRCRENPNPLVEDFDSYSPSSPISPPLENTSHSHIIQSNAIQVRALNLANLRVRAENMLRIVSNDSRFSNMDVLSLVIELQGRVEQLMEEDGGGVEMEEILEMLEMCEEFEVDPMKYVAVTLNNVAAERNGEIGVKWI